MEWRPHAEQLADLITHPHSRWRTAVADTPRHLLVPRWFERDDEADPYTWTMRAVDGPSDPQGWMRAAYADRTLITKLGTVHADHASAGESISGARPTSSGTTPSVVLSMLRHARVVDGAEVLDLATGTGYSAALLSHRLGDKRVTSIDVDPELTGLAAERLDAIGVHPAIETVDATGPLPGEYDRIIATVSVRPIPASWLAALRPGGRLVAAIAGTTLLLTADQQADGGAFGRIEREVIGFMPTRSGPEYSTDGGYGDAEDQEGEHVERGRLPLWPVRSNSDLATLLELAAPGISYGHRWNEGDELTMWLTHPDGSWARASAECGEVPDVHEGGPQRLWQTYEQVRAEWNFHGTNPALGAHARIDPDGTIHLSSGGWKTTVA